MSSIVLETSDWISYMKRYYLTIEDIINMEPGDKISLLCLDRNVYDFVSDYKSGEVMSPEIFFKDNYQLTYTHSHDLQGFVKWNYSGESSDSDSDSVYSDHTDTDDERVGIMTIFEFDIKYADTCWYPLKDGKLPNRDPQGFAKINDETIKYWKDYPINTHIGWRGPMVPMKYLKDAPKVYNG